jgi:hypothetical protein
MQKTERHYVHRILQLQRSAIELVLVAVVLAFGINIAASALPLILRLESGTALLTGLGMSILSLAYAVHRLSSSLSMSIKLQGVFLLGANNSPHEIERYRFSESTASHMLGLFAENKALGASWRKANLGLCFEGNPDPNKRHSELGHQLANEAIEYFVLDELSLHLSEYFDSDRKISDEVVSRIKRRDIPQLLLDNHFLEQFSRPMSEREAFKHHNDDVDHNVVAAWGENGEVFDQFELILPKGSSLERDNGALQIKTSRYTIKIASIFEGFATNLPSDFEELYLGVPFNTYSPRQVDLQLSIDFAWWSLLAPSGWDHYEWLDSFVEKLDRAFSFERFVHDVGWETAHSVAIAVRSATKARADAA